MTFFLDQKNESRFNLKLISCLTFYTLKPLNNILMCACLSSPTTDNPGNLFFPLYYILLSLQQAVVFWHFTQVIVENNKSQTFPIWFTLWMRICSFHPCWSRSRSETMEVSLAACLIGLKMCSWVWGSAHAKMLLTMCSALQSFSITHSWCASVWYFILFVGFFCMVSSASLSGCRMGLVWNTLALGKQHHGMKLWKPADHTGSASRETLDVPSAWITVENLILVSLHPHNFFLFSSGVSAGALLSSANGITTTSLFSFRKGH